MKTFLPIILSMFLSIPFSNAQNPEAYISLTGGKRRILLGGEPGYNMYRLKTNIIGTDTLICRGAGYERGYITKEFISGCAEAENLHFYNKAIRLAREHSRANNSASGSIKATSSGKVFLIRYQNSDRKGDIEIWIEPFV